MRGKEAGRRLANARRRLIAGCVGALALTALPVWGQATTPRPAAKPAAPAVRPAAATAPVKQAGNVMAIVNGEQIGRQELAQECLRRYGEEVLESLVNRQVIAQACKDHGVEITARDVNDEIKRIAAKFSLSVDRWLQMLESERGIGEEQYRNEIIWPSLALKALAADKLKITPAELQQAFETEFGPTVKARIIVVSKKEKALELHKQVSAKPESFNEVAKNHSEDVNSASAHGLIPPIRKHVGDPEIERVAFSLKEGQISPVLQVANQYFILKCEKHMPETVIPSQHLADAEQRLRDQLHDEKLRNASKDMFGKLQEESKVVNVYNDPKLRAQYPGVAAIINGQQLTIAQLADECIFRHGQDVLDGEINRKILLQELKRKHLQVEQEDLDREVARAAIAYGYEKPDGSPDLDRWQKFIEEQDGASIELYVRDAVWPSVALKKLVGDSVKITEEDLKKAYEANYGERVEALAIVLNNNRQAQQVWEMARANDSDEFFMQLAEQYSVDPVSRANGGRVPPIRKHSGQPKIEKMAFEMKAGDLSGILAVQDNFIFLRCLGRTRPIQVDFADVKEELQRDIHEKKIRVAMAKLFDDLRTSAKVDNILTGATQDGAPRVSTAPKADAAVKPAAGVKQPVLAPR